MPILSIGYDRIGQHVLTPRLIYPINRRLVFAMVPTEGIGAAHDLITQVKGTPTNAPTWIGSPDGYAINFPAAGTAHLDFTLPDSLFLNELTIVWRGLIRTGSAYRHFAGKHASAGATNSPFDFRTSNAATPLLNLGRASATGVRTWAGQAVTLGIVKTYAVTISSNDITTAPIFYVNGENPTAGSGTGSGTGVAAGSGADLVMGRRPDGTVQMDGYCLGCYIFNSVLNQAELRFLHEILTRKVEPGLRARTWSPDIPRDGVAVGVLDDLTGVATGTVLVQGVLAGTLDDVTGLITGYPGTGVQMAGTLDAVTGTAIGRLTTHGLIAVTLDDVTGTAVGEFNTLADQAAGFWAAAPAPTIVGAGNSILTPGAGAFYGSAPAPMVVGTPVIPVVPPTATPQTTVSADATAGDTILTVASTAGFVAGNYIRIQDGDGGLTRLEWASVTDVIDATHLQLDRQLRYTHLASQSDTVWIIGGDGGLVFADYPEAGFDHAWLVEIDWFGNGYQRYATRELKYQDQFYAGRVLLGEQDITVTRKLTALTYGIVEVTDIRFALNNGDGELDQLSAGEHRGDRIRLTLIDCTSGYASVELYGMVAKAERDVGRIWIDCRDIDLSMFEKMIPGDSAIIKSEDWPLAVDVGSMIPLPFGTVPKCPLRYVVKDDVNGIYSYIAGFGDLEIHHIYRIRPDGLLELIDPMLWPLVSSTVVLEGTTGEHVGGIPPIVLNDLAVAEGTAYLVVNGDFPSAPYDVQVTTSWGSIGLASMRTTTSFTLIFQTAAPANATVDCTVVVAVDFTGTWYLHVREPNFACAGPSRAIVVMVVADAGAVSVTYGVGAAAQSFTLLHEADGPETQVIGPIGPFPGLSLPATGAKVLQIWYLLNPPKGITLLDVMFESASLQSGAFPLPWVVGMVVTQVSQDPDDWAWETASGSCAVWDSPGPKMTFAAERHETIIAVMAAPNGAVVLMDDTAPRGMYAVPAQLTEVEVAGARLGYYPVTNAVPPPYTMTSVVWQEGKAGDVTWRLLVPYGQVLLGGHSQWTILGLRCKGIPAYGSTTADDRGPCLVTMVTMTVKQLDQNGSDVKLCADILESETQRNHALAIRQVLSNSCWGAGPQDIDEAAFSAVAAKLTALELYCDGAIVDQPMRLQDVLEQLMLVRGLRLRRTQYGWAVFMDEPQTAAKANVVTGDTIAPGDRVIQTHGLRTQSDIKDRFSRVILNYRFDFLKLASTPYLFYIKREVFGEPGQEKTYDVMFVRDHRTADKMLAYISRRAFIEDETITVTFDAYLRFLYEGDLVLLTIPALRYFSTILKLAERALDDEKESTQLVGYDLSIYDYVESIPFPPGNPTLGDLDDYSQIRPDPAEDLILVSAESIVNPDTIETVSVVLAFSIAETDNFAKAIVRYRTSWADELIATETAFQWTDAATVDHTGLCQVTLRGLTPLGHYDFTVSVVNAYKLVSIGDPLLMDQIMPARTPLAPTLHARVV